MIRPAFCRHPASHTPRNVYRTAPTAPSRATLGCMSSSRVTSFRNDALTFDVVDEGPLDGDIVVLLHGFPERASSWRGVTALLNEAGYRTIAPDQRGYSPGARPRRRARGRWMWVGTTKGMRKVVRTV